MYKMAKAAWVAALRSGEYQQATGVLCRLDDDGTPVGYCCLGVLCDLAAKDGVPLELLDEYGWRRWDNSDKVLPDTVAKWAGLVEDGIPQSNPIIRPRSVEDEPLTAAGANDGGMNFAAIADLIEANL